MAKRKPVEPAAAIDVLGDMIELADAWASCGPEGYTPEERKRRNAADRLYQRLISGAPIEGAPIEGAPIVPGVSK
jgi:hypothetical protein